MTSVAIPNAVLDSTWISTPTDGLTGETLTTQLATEQAITEVLNQYLPSFDKPAPPTLPPLDRTAHINFITRILANPLPAPFVALDASRPWLLYWSLHSLSLLGSGLDAVGKTRVVETLRACQNEQGGFGGGPGQISHLAPSYAAISALAYVGTEEGWNMVDRKGMLRFLKSVKQPDGSFVMHKGGEVDVRGCYCALTVATLLNILTPSLALNTSSFVASCQTYEGGLASSSNPSSSSQTPAKDAYSVLSPSLGEAHGGYAFCAAASYSLLLSYPKKETLDLNALTRWATAMQANPIEGAGFRGRTNKLVDGCYGWWGGGLFGVIGSLMSDKEGREVDGGELFDRVGLQSYVLLLAQGPQGGLRDKPGKHPDAYHTCYNLSGLSSAQHNPITSPSLIEEQKGAWKKMMTELDDDGNDKVELIGDEDEDVDEREERMKEVWSRAKGWKVKEEDRILLGGEGNQVEPTHPVLNLEVKHAYAMLDYFYLQQ